MIHTFLTCLLMDVLELNCLAQFPDSTMGRNLHTPRLSVVALTSPVPGQSPSNSSSPLQSKRSGLLLKSEKRKQSASLQILLQDAPTRYSMVGDTLNAAQIKKLKKMIHSCIGFMWDYAETFPYALGYAHLLQGRWYWINSKRSKAEKSWTTALSMAEDNPQLQAYAHYELGNPSYYENNKEAKGKDQKALAQEERRNHLDASIKLFHEFNFSLNSPHLIHIPTPETQPTNGDIAVRLVKNLGSDDEKEDTSSHFNTTERNSLSKSYVSRAQPSYSTNQNVMNMNKGLFASTASMQDSSSLNAGNFLEPATPEARFSFNSAEAVSLNVVKEIVSPEITEDDTEESRGLPLSTPTTAVSPPQQLSPRAKTSTLLTPVPL